MLVVPPSGQNWNQWSVQFEFSSGAIWWVDLELMLVVSSGQNWNQYGVFNLNCPFYWIFLLCSWRDKSSYRSNAWVRCASGNVFYLIFTIICFPTLSKKFFWKKLKNVNVTSHHQAIINNNIIIRSWNSEQSWLLQKLIGGVYFFVLFQNFSGWEKTHRAI